MRAGTDVDRQIKESKGLGHHQSLLEGSLQHLFSAFTSTLIVLSFCHKSDCRIHCKETFFLSF